MAVAELWPRARAVGDQFAVRCVFMRGGTSRGAFLHAADLPLDPKVRDRAILAMYGSPDPRQIDGLGGADPLTSKVAIIGPPTYPGADVDYLFGQVQILEPLVDYRGNCGNMLAGVGPFAIDEGLVVAHEPTTEVRIHNVNTGTLVLARVPTRGGRALVAGSTAVPGVPRTGAGITLDFAERADTLGRGLLPTGRARQELTDSAGKSFRVSLIDAGNPTVFVLATDLGLDPASLMAKYYPPDLMDQLEAIRGAAAHELEFIRDRGRSPVDSPTIPKMYLVHPPADYIDSAGGPIHAGSVDLLARGLSMQRLHAAYAATVAIATAAAACLSGTVVHEVTRPRTGHHVRIGHPGGVLVLEAEVDTSAVGGPRLATARIERTARRLMSGDVLIPREALA